MFPLLHRYVQNRNRNAVTHRFGCYACDPVTAHADHRAAVEAPLKTGAVAELEHIGEANALIDEREIVHVVVPAQHMLYGPLPFQDLEKAAAHRISVRVALTANGFVQRALRGVAVVPAVFLRVPRFIVSVPGKLFSKIIAFFDRREPDPQGLVADGRR